MFSFTFYFDSKYVIMQKKKKKRTKKEKVLRNDIKEESIYLPKAIC